MDFKQRNLELNLQSASISLIDAIPPHTPIHDRGSTWVWAPFQAPNGWAQPPNLPKIKRYNGTTVIDSAGKWWKDHVLEASWGLVFCKMSAAGFYEVLEVHALACLKALVNRHCAMHIAIGISRTHPSSHHLTPSTIMHICVRNRVWRIALRVFLFFVMFAPS